MADQYTSLVNAGIKTMDQAVKLDELALEKVDMPFNEKMKLLKSLNRFKGYTSYEQRSNSLASDRGSI
jgi:hypothetical protein